MHRLPKFAEQSAADLYGDAFCVVHKVLVHLGNIYNVAGDNVSVCQIFFHFKRDLIGLNLAVRSGIEPPRKPFGLKN